MIESAKAQVRRPPVPRPAERAKTIAVRDGAGLLIPRLDPPGERFDPVLHQVHPAGSVTVLLPDDHPLTSAAIPGELSCVFELTDLAAVALRERVRGLLWITGMLRILVHRAARARAILVAEDRPDHRLLDVGNGLSVLELRPSTLVLADADGTHSLRPHEFRTAAPDPFHAEEDSWLRHLEHSHPDVVAALARHLPPELRNAAIRPLGLDRLGLRLRVEAPIGDHDVRLAFSRPVHCRNQLAAEMCRLVGCPFLARYPGNG